MSLSTGIDALAARVAQEIKDVRAQEARLIFQTVAELNAFTGSPGQIGFVQAAGDEYLWRAGWKLWSRPVTAFVPTISSAGNAHVTVGNGSWLAYYWVSAGVATAVVQFTLGSTTVVGSVFAIDLPIPGTVPVSVPGGGGGRFLVQSSFTYYLAWVASTSTFVVVRAIPSAAAYSTIVDVGPSVPFTWSVSDVISFTVSWPV